ncbi:PXA domain-containing protein [Cubamyces menziesii]|nr:PXA domain-containing protein [Cubamyces menziesii]
MSTAPPSARRIGPRSIQSVASSSHDKSVLSTRPPQAKPVTLPKRLLFPSLPPDADLPPLLASPAAAPELNAELYDFIALALRAYVNPWWTKITRYDKEFLPEITRILTHVFRALESRLVATDLSPLVFRDLPALLNQHWTDYRNAQAKLHTSYATGGAATLPQLFHQMQPHMAVSPEGIIDVVYVRQAVDHILKACLPAEDYEPETERYIVREVILKVLAGSVLPRVTQPWFIHKMILDLMGPEKPADKGTESPASHDDAAFTERPSLQRRSSHHFSFQALAIFVLSAVQSVSGVCLSILHAYRQARETIRRVNQSSGSGHPPDEPKDAAEKAENDTLEPPSASGLKEGASSPAPPTPALPGSLSVPPRKSPAIIPPTPPSPSSESATSFMSPVSNESPSHGLAPSISPSPSLSPDPAPSSPPPPQIPNYTHPPLTFLLTLLTPPPLPPSSHSNSPSSPLAPSSASTKAPAAHGSHTTARALTHLLTLLGALCAPFLARLLPYLLYAHVLCAPTLASIVRAARRALFPEGWPAPPPVDPSPEEQVEMRERLRRRIGEAVPGPLAPLLGPTPAARTATVDAALAPLDSQACNAHLVVFVLDLVLLTVFPEMGVSEADSG